MNLGMTLGMIFGAGLLLCGAALIRTTPPLWVQISPYVGSTQDTKSAWQRTVAQVTSNLLVHRPQSLWGNDRQVAQLLAQAARAQILRDFRQQQIRFAGLATLGVGAWIVLRMTSSGGISPVLGCLLLTSAPVGGGWYAKWSLASAASGRVTRIEQQLPMILDLLAFALAAGQAILPALKKISQMCSGDLAQELEQVVTSVSTGIPLGEALEEAQLRVNSDAFTRTVRALVVALERGTPLALVLRAQANDARSLSQRHLVELASKKETAMMLPVVFFILPMIVVVALYPGLIALQMM
jgi:tight adherence protein C